MTCGRIVRPKVAPRAAEPGRQRARATRPRSAGRPPRATSRGSTFAAHRVRADSTQDHDHSPRTSRKRAARRRKERSSATHAGLSTGARVLRARRRLNESRRRAGSTGATGTLDTLGVVAHLRLDVKPGIAPLSEVGQRPTSRRPILTSSRMSSAMDLASS